MPQAVSEISVRSLAREGALGTLLRVTGPLLDRMLGIKNLAELYDAYELGGLDHQAFTARFLEKQNVRVEGAEELLRAVPRTGPAVVVCNHPFGGIEGIALASLLTAHRSDVKILANAGLSVFANLQRLFIFANPLSPSSHANVAPLRQCDRHLGRGGLLVVFPAGRVSAFRRELGRVADAPWNRLAARLALKHEAPVTTVFVAGTNSAWFHRVGRVHPRLRMFMLARELLAFRDRTLHIHAGPALAPTTLGRLGEADEVNAVLRVSTYLRDPAFQTAWPSAPAAARSEDIAPPSDRERMIREVTSLHPSQQLVRFKHFGVYYGYQEQLPETVHEITRLRERTFRLLDEGSGKAVDTDGVDATYMHLFVRNEEDGAIVGAYRLGATDELLRRGGPSQLYLNAMFEFGPTFPNQVAPCLELGRSFIVPEYQRSPYGLLLLWRGIGELVARHPRYRTLYGTVSLSKMYSPTTVDLIGRALLQPDGSVVPRAPLNVPPHPELLDYLHGRRLSITELSHLVQILEDDGKDLPVLVKQYAKLGARFHCIGVDGSFNGTPGMLLTLDLPSAPRNLLDRYLGDKAAEYLAFTPHVSMRAHDHESAGR
jgi:putative hemolysin